MVEALCCVGGYIVYAVLHCAVLQFGLLFFHLSAIGVYDFSWLEPYLPSCFEVDELVRARVVVELQFVRTVEGVE